MRGLATTARMVRFQTEANSGQVTYSPAFQVPAQVDQIARHSAQVRAFHRTVGPTADHCPNPCHRWLVDRDGSGARWSRLDPMALRSQGDLAIES
jgi:hypothetical protein